MERNNDSSFIPYTRELDHQEIKQANNFPHFPFKI